MNNLEKVMIWNGAAKSEAKMRSTLQRTKAELERHLKRISASLEIEYTGLFVLLRKDGAGWAFVTLFNPTTWPDDQDEPEWDQAIPVPKLDTIPEHPGW